MVISSTVKNLISSMAQNVIDYRVICTVCQFGGVSVTTPMVIEC